MNKGRLGLGENKMNTIMRGGRRKKKQTQIRGW
jgi:hypothetical protein